MPLYEFRCVECDHEFEQFFGIHEDKATICPKCNAEAKKRISAPRSKIMFKAGYMHTLGQECSSEADYKEKHAAMRRKLQAEYES